MNVIFGIFVMMNILQIIIAVIGILVLFTININRKEPVKWSVRANAYVIISLPTVFVVSMMMANVVNAFSNFIIALATIVVGVILSFGLKVIGDHIFKNDFLPQIKSFKNNEKGDFVFNKSVTIVLFTSFMLYLPVIYIPITRLMGDVFEKL